MTGHGVLLEAGALILTNRGVDVVMHLERHGVRVKNMLGEQETIRYDHLVVAAITDSGVQAVHISVEPWWSSLDSAHPYGRFVQVGGRAGNPYRLP